MEQNLQKVQQELKSDEWELRVDGLKALTKLGEETRTPDQQTEAREITETGGHRQARDGPAAQLKKCGRGGGLPLRDYFGDGARQRRPRVSGSVHWTATLLGVASGRRAEGRAGGRDAGAECYCRCCTAPIGNAALL